MYGFTMFFLRVLAAGNVRERVPRLLAARTSGSASAC